MTTVDRDDQPRDAQPWEGCPVASSRRAFLRDAAAAAAAALAAVSIGRPAMALARAVSETAPRAAHLMERTYPIPPPDSVAVDVGNQVILAHWENRVYAFSLKCPHKGSRLEWRPSEQRVFCPKHKARFLADGSHASGRGKRDLDRYGLRRSPDGVVVNLATAYRSDTDPDAWENAVLSV